MNQIYEDAKVLQKELVSWRRHIHQNPELGMQLPKTSDFVKRKLEEMGYKPQRIGGDGLVAMVGNKPGKCFMLRADMDALPIKEEADIDFKSENGNMHACGHDMHTTMLLGAAKLLKEYEDEICGQIKLLFQPGEEIQQGAQIMIENGVLDNPKVDAAAMFHVAAGTPIPTGVIFVGKEGPFTSTCDDFEFRISGRGSHGASPEQSVDPINVMCQIYTALQTICSREISPSSEAVITVGHVESGSAKNIIPDKAFMEGTIRTYDSDVREFVLKRVAEIAEGVAKTHRAEVDVRILRGCPSVINDKTVTEVIRTSLQQVFGAYVPNPNDIGFQKLTGSEDFSYITQKVPSVMMMISAGSIQEGYEYIVHHPKAIFNEAILSQGAAAYAIAAMSWLENNNTVSQ